MVGISSRDYVLVLFLGGSICQYANYEILLSKNSTLNFIGHRHHYQYISVAVSFTEHLVVSHLRECKKVSGTFAGSPHSTFAGIVLRRIFTLCDWSYMLTL